MGRVSGFLDYERREPGHRPPDERLRDFRAVDLTLDAAALLEQAARCMDCGTPFCHGCGCPLNNVIPELNDLAYRQRWKDGLDLLLTTNNFPEFTGRICPAPCEGACVLGIHSEPVTIRLIELAIIEKAFEQGTLTPRPPAERLNRRLAVVGSGPAGLTVADTVNRAGYGVVVYDDARRPGGVLRYGIPEFKLEKWVLDRRLRLMEEEGVRFETGVRVGEDVSLHFLQDRFDALCISGGAREPRDLPIPGRDLRGIHFAMPYLAQQNRRLGGEAVAPGPLISAAGRRVLIVGGGDTGADCLGTALRQGAVRVVQCEILPEPPLTRSPSTAWPAWPYMRRDSSSHAEGGERLWSVSPREFLGEGGAVRGARLTRVVWDPPDGGPGACMTEAPGNDFRVEAELVLLAMGFTGTGNTRLTEALGLALDERGFPRRDGQNMTSVRGVFVAGDMAQGASLVVRAIADGRRTAEGIVRYFEEMPGSHTIEGGPARAA